MASQGKDPCLGLLKVIPLGGLGEIGLNMMAVQYEDSILVIDAGLMFPEDYMPGVDIVIPDFGYLRENRKKLAGIAVTHGHEDHIGALPFLLQELDAPVFATPFTLGLIRYKLEEQNPRAASRLFPVKAGERFDVGPFNVETIPVSHSVAGGVGLAIRTPAGLLVHTGDFKISQASAAYGSTDLGRFAQLGAEGVLALFSDSTNAEKEGYTISEAEIGRTLEEIIRKSPGRVIVAVFASNIPRIAQVMDIARRMQKKIFLSGRSMETSVRLATDLGLLRIGRNMEMDEAKIDSIPDHKAVILTTGTQGEPMSALARISAGAHKYIRIKKDDTVILSSRFIPGNEKAIAGIINRLFRQGADVVYEKVSAIHVSGHAFREELKVMLQVTRPKYFVPVHGEYRHLVHHSRLAMGMGMPANRVLLAENGDVILLDGKKAWIEGRVETGRVLVDGKGVGDVGASVLRERRALSEHGMVVVNMILDQETGLLLHGPELSSRGFVFEDENAHLIEEAQNLVQELVEESDPCAQDRIPVLRERIQKALRKHFNSVIRRRPVILPVIVEV